MNTSDLLSIGSRPLLPTAQREYKQEAKDVLMAKLEASFALPPPPEVYATYQFEFPGDRTYERYLNERRV